MNELRPTMTSIWIPLAALLITLAALTAHLPARLAARAKPQAAPQSSLSSDLVPTVVDYPLPARSRWFAAPETGSLLAHR